MFDFLFELTEYSENEGEQILVECKTLNEAYHILGTHGFEPEEYEKKKKISVVEGEMLGLDTY